jgi:hypothetical protein
MKTIDIIMDILKNELPHYDLDVEYLMGDWESMLIQIGDEQFLVQKR